MNRENTKVITGPGTRFSYCSVWAPRSANGRKPRYGVCLLIPKTDQETVEKIRAAIQRAYVDGAEVLKNEDGSLPPIASLKMPMRDGDGERPEDPAYKGQWYLNATSVQPPEVVDDQVRAIFNRASFYSGCYGRASIYFYAYRNEETRGIACGLNHVQKLRDGEALTNRTSAVEDFT